MTNLNLSPMERAVLEVFHELYKDNGFPSPGKVRVHVRENTGSGRYLDLSADGESELEDGYLDMGGGFIEMEGVPYGLMAVVSVKNHQIYQLEVAVYGNCSWDGEEREWSIVGHE